ncbi:MAG TPA: hypothetical protein VLT82_15195 [Myxococcaceae bacterium]|nr:hypothetical protein [Myxococcaceae bacterium]
MTAIRTPSDRAALRAEAERAAREPDLVRRQLLSLRARVRMLAEEHARLGADGLTCELRSLGRETAFAMRKACEGWVVIARLHHRLTRRLNSDSLRPCPDDEASVELRARAVVLAELDALLEVPESPRSRSGHAYAHADLTPGAARALRILEQHRETVRSRFRELRCTLQTDLAELSLQMAAETAAGLLLRHGRDGREWLSWRVARIVEELVKVSAPPSLAGALENLAIRSVLAVTATRPPRRR